MLLILFPWKPKLSLPLRFTPSNLAFSSFTISVLEICISMDVLELVKRWHLPPFATKLFVENQRNIFSYVPCRLSSTFFFFGIGYVSSIVIRICSKVNICWRFKKHIIDICILNKTGPKMESWGTPENKISHEPTSEPAFVLFYI